MARPARPSGQSDRGGPQRGRTRSGNPAVRSGAAPVAPTARATVVPSARPPLRRAAATLRRAFGSPPAVMEVRGLFPPDGVAYPQTLRTSQFALWRSLVGVAFGLSLYALATILIAPLVVFLGWVLGAASQPYRAFSAAAHAFEKPVGLLSANLAIAALIPISYLLMTMVHQVAPRWLSSVQPRLRWGYLFRCLALATVALLGVQVLAHVIMGPTLKFQPQPGFWGFFVVIVLTSPIQAAAEEMFFRGYLLQACGSLVRQPWVGVFASSLLFALFHGTQNLPLFLDRLAFGLLAAILVVRTGGLEAGIAAHVINNVFAYLIAGLTGSIAATRALQKIDWATAGFDVGGFALFAVLAYLLARWMRLRNQVDLTVVRSVA